MASGELNNCLIHSLSQCLGIYMVNVYDVRRDLLREFSSATDEDARVEPESFLDLESHWASIIRSLNRHNQARRIENFDTSNIRVVCLYDPPAGSNTSHGNVVGNHMAQRTLVVMNLADRHFEPCLRLHAGSS